MGNEEGKKQLIELLRAKTGLKQDVYANAKQWFAVFKEELKSCIDLIKDDISDDRIRLKYLDKGESEAHLYIGSDILVFYLHTNIFRFNDKNYVAQTSYVKNNPENAYCGIINIYNFLADSYEYNRPNDLGYLIGRVFVNKENHFVVEGKGQLDFLYRDFMHQVLTPEILQDLILRSAMHAIDFDLLTPPYQSVQQVSVYDMQTLTQSSKLKTGKRLGFKFQSDKDIQA
ncbi:MAG: hypothetical protein MI810_11205 [Flavobacteriales bacterium]|nr:hypothetical protein [Flavobacteriales bacterium]